MSKWKKGAGCLGYIGDDKSYPVMWGLYYIPWNKIPSSMNQYDLWKVGGLYPLWMTLQMGSWGYHWLQWKGSLLFSRISRSSGSIVDLSETRKDTASLYNVFSRWFLVISKSPNKKRPQVREKRKLATFFWYVVLDWDFFFAKVDYFTHTIRVLGIFLPIYSHHKNLPKIGKYTIHG